MDKHAVIQPDGIRRINNLRMMCEEDYLVLLSKSCQCLQCSFCAGVVKVYEDVVGYERHRLMLFKPPLQNLKKYEDMGSNLHY